jgi:GNAT superfamily N-acetyltransferase
MKKARKSSVVARRSQPAPARTRRPAATGGRKPAPVRAAASPAGFAFHPLTPDRWADLERLFGARGACAGCWCMFPRRTTTEGATSGEPNRRAFKKIVAEGPPPGLLAYDGGDPVGWVAIAPRSEYVRFERSRVLKPVDDQPVWSVPCFFIARTHRAQGLSVALLRAACEWAGSRGASIVEGYPVDTKGVWYSAAFAFHGLPATFEAAGFREVLRRSDRRPIMRRALVKARKPSRVPARASASARTPSRVPTRASVRKPAPRG